MGNLNDLITDEDADEVENLPNIEEDPQALKIKKNLDELFSSLESFKNKYELREYVSKHGTINKKIAQEANQIFDGFIGTKRMIESFSEDNSRINYDDSLVFMTTSIDNNEINAITLLKEVFTTGLEECSDFYDSYINKIRPRIEKAYNELYMFISENQYLVDLSSILFMKNDEDGKAQFVDTFDMTLKEIVESDLETIPESFPAVSFSKYKDIVKEICTLLDNNKDFFRLTKMIADNNTQIPIPTIYNTQIVDLSLSPKDIYSIFIGKGLWYYSNMETLLDYVVNLVNLKKYDYDEFAKINAPLSSYLIDINQEIKEVRDALSFMLEYVNNIGKFIHLSYRLFELLK